MRLKRNSYQTGRRRLDSLGAALYLAAATSLRPRVLPAGFVAPCLPTNAPQPPSGELWLHEIKHDGFRVIARKNGRWVKLYSRPGNDLTYRFPLIVEALAKLRSRSCIIDGEAVACSEDGIACFDHIRYRRHDGRARICEDDEVAHGQQLLTQKYGLLKLFGDFFSRLTRHKQSVIAVEVD